MTEHQQPDGVWFQFSLPEEGSHLQHILLRYKGTTQVHIDYTDTPEGYGHLGLVMASVPKVVRAVRQEVMIRRETANVDDELRGLLDPEGD